MDDDSGESAVEDEVARTLVFLEFYVRRGMAFRATYTSILEGQLAYWQAKTFSSTIFHKIMQCAYYRRISTSNFTHEPSMYRVTWRQKIPANLDPLSGFNPSSAIIVNIHKNKTW